MNQKRSGDMNMDERESVLIIGANTPFVSKKDQ